ncbi:MAG TPA: polysaccharide deacetylase family protein, partial [Sandaracinaceae bacterium LLY-WYZ-13_1]|nr:polysaccharide deacetylase family protein [Sandaracinaceae bacterium LLY-WYZ-13_1]
MRTAENLFLHYVSDGPPARRQTISRAGLRRLVERARAARAPAALPDYADGAPPGPDRFTISFDDAHVSVVRHALPTLRALDVPATLFVPTAYVETGNEWASWDDLRRLRDAGWT